MLVVGLASVACLWISRDERWRAGEARTVVAGLAVMAAGAGPYVTYLYQPFGVGDRFNYVSSVGGALVWVGVGAFALRHLPRPVALVGFALVAGLTLAGRVHESRLWSQATADAGRVGVQVASAPPVALGREVEVVLSPAGIPSHEAIGPFFDLPNVRVAVAYLLWRDDIQLEQATEREGFERAERDPDVISLDLVSESSLGR